MAMMYPAQPMLPRDQSSPHIITSGNFQANSFVTSPHNQAPLPQQMAIGSSPTYQTTSIAPNAAAYGIAPNAGRRNHGAAAVNGHQPQQRVEKCEEAGECAEEECDPDQCGAENQGPRGDTCGGFDSRPVLPFALAISTFVGWMCMVFCQIPLMVDLFDLDFTIKIVINCCFGVLYVTTLFCMVYCSCADPGQISKDSGGQSHSGYSGVEDQREPLPKRAHKTWQYGRAVRRYDHYCRWLVNCIGLLNHREFVLLLLGLFWICLIGVGLDILLGVMLISRGMLMDHKLQASLIGGHIVYSFIVGYLEFPILKIHMGLISRNELASEWKRNEFYIARRCKRGRVNVHVNDLSDDEFNDLFDEFVYDPQRNGYDKGRGANCWTFWCMSRWPVKQRGDF